MTTPVPDISVVPAFPSIGNRATYNIDAFAWATHMRTVFPSDMQSLATNAYANAQAAVAAASAAGTAASTASTKAGEAVTSALAAAGSASASALSATSAANSALAIDHALTTGPVLTVNGMSGVVTIPLSTVKRSARTSNAALAAADTTKMISCTGTWTQTFGSAASLGDGWFVYLYNAGSGDITLDPNASELIDGLASYVMYPGEVRLVQCDGTAFTSIVLQTFVKVFTAAATNTKPPGYRYFSGFAWGAGGGGGGANGGGGGGGACVPFLLPESAVPASSSVVIGAGGAAGSTGGNTTIFGVTAYGGGSGTTQGGAGGGSASAGAGTVGGLPRLAATAAAYTHPFGGADGAVGPPAAAGWYGGGAGSQNSQGPAGGSQYGGGGGMGYAGVGAGASVFGGNGATNAAAATAPGGGGAYATNTSGARGEARYWGVM